MALRFIDSFDHYDTSQILRKWSAKGGSTTISAGTGRHGSASAHATQLDFNIRKDIDNQQTWIAGCAFKIAGLQENIPIISFLDGATTQVDVYLDAFGVLRARRNAATVLGTTAAVISAGAYNYIEVKVKIHSSTGTVDVKVNGISVLSLTGQNTQQSGNAYASSIKFGLSSGAFGVPNMDFDDVYICDDTGSANNDFLGDVRVDATVPTAEGTTNDWTPSTGTDNSALVDDNPANDDTDYNSSATAGQIDLYNFPPIAPTAGTVFGVAIQMTVRKDDAGSRTYRGKIRQGGSNYSGTTVGAGDSYIINSEIHEVDPDTSAAWTISGVNSAEYGIELVS